MPEPEVLRILKLSMAFIKGIRSDLSQHDEPICFAMVLVLLQDCSRCTMRFTIEGLKLTCQFLFRKFLLDSSIID